MKPAIKLTRAGESGKISQPDWLVYNVLPSGFSVLFGAPGGAKTFVALHFGMLIAAGKPWRKHSTKQRTVIYLYAEGSPEAIERRVCAAMTELQLTAEERKRVPFFHAQIPMLFGEEDGYLMNVLDQMREQIEAQGAARDGALVIIDTVGRAMAGDENNTKDMAAFVRAMDTVAQWANHGSVWGIHHTNKAGDLRGNISLFGAVECLIRVTRSKWNKVTWTASVGLTNGKQKDGRESELAALQIREFCFRNGDGSFLLDDEGEKVHTCCITYNPAEETPTEDRLAEEGVMEAVRTFYAKTPGGRLTKNVLEGLSGLRRDTHRSALSRLEARGTVLVDASRQEHVVSERV